MADHFDDELDDEPVSHSRYASPAECKAMSDDDLANHIENSRFEYDGLSFSARIAIVRLLRK